MRDGFYLLFFFGGLALGILLGVWMALMVVSKGPDGERVPPQD